jgi:hypothetical protein
MNLLLSSMVDVEAIVLSGVQFEREKLLNMTTLLRFVLGNILQNDGPSRIERAAAELRATGELHLREARSSTRDEAFYGHLFRACPSLYGAKMAFEYLAAISPPNSPTRKSNEDQDHASEELLVFASTSLLNHFENLHQGWAKYQNHTARIAALRTLKGAGAAEGRVMEYTGLSHLYPPYYRKALLNGLPPPPETAGTSGGAAIGKLCGIV